jgi:murein DD-endopeptidase MepM/ murein hydrolase activator NlpD
VRHRLALLAPLIGLLALGSAGAVGPATTPTATATAWAIQVVLPAGGGASTPSVSSPPNPAPVAGGVFAYPADGSVVSAQSSTVSATTSVAAHASAKAESVVTAVSLFGGEITADAVTGRASAGTGPSGAGGNANGSTVTNLLFSGQPVSGTKVQLADWGVLTLDAQTVDDTAAPGTRAYHGVVTELDVKLTLDHKGLPAGSEIRIGYAETAVQTAPPATATTTTPATTTPATTTPATTPGQAATDEAPVGDRPNDRPRHSSKVRSAPLNLQPQLTADHYVFPVYGPSSYSDTFGAPRADVSYHHGDDIFGQLGQPLLACADGTLFSVGWNKVGGNRLWLLDSQGNQFYYAHLSAFSTLAVNGAHVKAGQVIGFMGNTGDAEGTPVHLHFEVHPVSLLYLGYDGAVDPTPYLDAWSHQQDLAFPVGAGWAPAIPGRSGAPEPGAILLGMTDISTADGLDPASLERALKPLDPAALVHALVPPVKAPASDLGRG